MTRNTQVNTDEAKVGQINKLNNQHSDQAIRTQSSETKDSRDHHKTMDCRETVCEGEKYWQMMYAHLKNDYDHLQKVNQNLEDKLLNIVDAFEKKKEELIANSEFEKSTLMADVNKLSTKLVDARMKLHDREEKDILHAAECASPCHTKTTPSQVIPIAQSNQKSSQSYKFDQQQMINDPNLV